MDFSETLCLSNTDRPLISNRRIASVDGFGQVSPSAGYLYRPTSVQEVKDVLETAASAGRQVVLRGAGRSYGDAAVGQETLILNLQRMNQVYSFNKLTGEIDCQAGVTIEDLWRLGIEDGFWPPVVSGTMFPTLGGALAMNIHGKNNFAVGTLGEHVTELDVVFPNGDVRTLTPESPLFRAIVSSAGLLGVIVRVRLQMKRIESGDLRVLPVSVPNWDGFFDAFDKFESEADYMVGWIDAFGRGSGAGRGLFHAAWYQHEEGASPTSLRPDHQDLPSTIMGVYPKASVWKILRLFNTRLGMRLLNAAKYHSSRLLGDGRPHPQSLVAFSFLLDYVPDWRKAYKRGFVQFQSFVPKESARHVFARQIELQQQAGLEANLAVIKRHRADSFLFSHGVDGYSLALDFRIPRQGIEPLRTLARQMARLVLENGGRFYLAKDSLLEPAEFQESVGAEALDTYARLKSELDPQSILTSSLAKRLGLDPKESA